ncbi:uncharacterized protein CC84DRAFT_809870 [Paraphaeosphaeria sporulosa]|uniref:Uncharacterized protein n=1 Tax=Paraphaeosphaeria sporulosa TaxID=1460663 RepID=A0A177CDQ8_9PLEO|nr:uncharacterized protein CC84DRAFT_809870 [Paraphaeosphaeria sporulosa]OAG04939.1 hypothetical protein CC84DRAFT_809870 [Paraphaeosphaeria sporulosa]
MTKPKRRKSLATGHALPGHAAPGVIVHTNSRQLCISTSLNTRPGCTPISWYAVRLEDMYTLRTERYGSEPSLPRPSARLRSSNPTFSPCDQISHGATGCLFLAIIRNCNSSVATTAERYTLRRPKSSLSQEGSLLLSIRASCILR